VPNRLIDSTSPYLLQHAHNPVDWHPWGEEALARARAEDKPILLSIGYSACHWCHVMERESFEDEAIAALMNENFVCVKVDREERPDLDDIYMAATVAMNHGQGGWPMTVFLTPEQAPFFAGTYFPPVDRYGRPGFPTLLRRIADGWREDREGLRRQGAELVELLSTQSRTSPGLSLGEADLRRALDECAAQFDERFGGFGGAPKFPPAVTLQLLLRAHRRFGEARALEMAGKTLDEMARGGMYDQVGGGFHRYSVDERWLVPHFEKMLYDNALLARAYLEGWQATGDPFHRRIATEVLDYVRREMTSPEGAFFSATDADSEGEEGRFFVWQPAEVEAVLGEEDGRLFCAYYDISERGNWEGKSIPNTSRTGTAVARSLGLAEGELEERVATLRGRVYEARRRRVPPGLDDKILTAWNGLMIGSFAEGARALGEPSYLQAARAAADFVLATLRRPDGGLWRTWRAGVAHLDAYLEDHAYLAEGLLDLYEAGGDVRYLREAIGLAERIRDEFADPAGGFFSTARGHEPLIVRHREGHDGATPAPNAVAAHVLARLAFHLDRDDLREEALRGLRAYAKAISRSPRAFARSLVAADFLLEGPVELAFVGPAGDAGLRALRGAVGRRFLPNRIVESHGGGTAPPPDLPLLTGKDLVDGRSALFVCRGFACRQPVTRPEDVARALGDALPGERRTTLGARLAGHATAAATAGHAAAFAGRLFGPLGATGLTCSRVGFGGYRVDDETPVHREALEKALREGCNLLDTSTNYTDGGSEHLFGETLGAMARRGLRRRDEVVVVSKIGYVQGENLERARARAAAGRPFPEMVEYAEGVWHCVHPEFLEDQLERSLERLGLETLDVCLLHNPEYFLKDAHERSHGKLEGRRDEFYRRLREAFAWLEGQVAAGRLCFYGVSSNTCTLPASDPEATSLTRMLEAAAAASGAGHRFRVLQLPLNLFEAGAVLNRNNGPTLAETVLDHAAARGVGVLVNRPLNAMAGEGMVRLASVAVPDEGPGLARSLADVAEREGEFRRDLARHLRMEGGRSPAQLFTWARDLEELPRHLKNLEHWRHVHEQRVLPRLVMTVNALEQAFAQGGLAAQWAEWRDGYLAALERLFAELQREAAVRGRAVADAVEGALDPRLPAERRGESLSRKALWVAASTPGVSGVLCGMRTPAYVDDALGVLRWPPLADVTPVYEAMRDVAVPT
jgi:uncharacterized protein YyaL (SSP411 family)/aryl-alcohol dehydrogenase-like predicted oxidoreductase